MEAHEHKIQLRISQLRNQRAAIDRMLQLDYRETLTSGIRDRLKSVRAKSEALLKKLESGEFEIAIVGNEKTGKSVFANALMGNDILPSADKRCTYTATSIRYGTEDEAAVEFFDEEKFDSDFRDKLRLMGVKDWDRMSFSQTTLESYQAVWKSLDEAARSANRELNWDLMDILTPENKRVIEAHLGRETLSFSGGETLLGQGFKKYICEPGYAHAVKEVTVKSSLLKDMPEAVIYDVPGLNSPTRIHKDQTIEKMLRADAIVLIVRADEPSFTDSLVEMFDPQKDASRRMDEDGAPLEKKLFVFANKADRANNLNENMRTIRNELEKRSILPPDMFDKRVVCGSAQAHLEASDVVKGNEAWNVLKQSGLDDGIDEIRRRLTLYYHNERFRIMEARVDRMEADLRAIFRELLAEEPDAFFIGEQERIVTETLDRARKKARLELEKYSYDLTQKYDSKKQNSLTTGLASDIAAKIQPELLAVTEEELNAAVYECANGSNITSPDHIDQELRKKKKAQVVNAFHNYMTTFAADEHAKCEREIVDKIEFSLRAPDDNAPNPALTQAVRAYVEERRAGRLHGESYNGYYDSLVSRFTFDLFDLLLGKSFGGDARWQKWKTDSGIFFSLAMFSSDIRLQQSADRQPFQYLLLFHDENAYLFPSKLAETVQTLKDYLERYLEGMALTAGIMVMVKKLAATHPEDALPLLQRKLPIANNASRSFFGSGQPQNVNKEEKVEEVLQELIGGQEAPIEAEEDLYLNAQTYRNFFQNRPMKTLDTVRTEINRDIEILQRVLRDVAVPAICMEKAFLDLETRTIRNLLSSLDDDFRNFVAEHIRMIAGDRYRALEFEREKRRIRAGIRAELKKRCPSFILPPISTSDAVPAFPVKPPSPRTGATA